jgi:Chalcone isomerase-like
MIHRLSLLAGLRSLRHGRLVAVWLCACLALTSPSWAARDVRGVGFSDQDQVAGQPVVLNGAGVRVKVVLDVYAAGLYLPHRDATVQGVLDMTGAKSMHIVLLRDLTGEDFADAMVKSFRRNNTDSDVAKFQARIDMIRDTMMALGKVAKGTSIHIDYAPGVGTRAVIAGVQKGPDIPGADFYTALLRIWLGSRPVDDDLKVALLGGH